MLGSIPSADAVIVRGSFLCLNLVRVWLVLFCHRLEQYASWMFPAVCSPVRSRDIFRVIFLGFFPDVLIRFGCRGELFAEGRGEQGATALAPSWK